MNIQYHIVIGVVIALIGAVMLWTRRRRLLGGLLAVGGLGYALLTWIMMGFTVNRGPLISPEESACREYLINLVKAEGGPGMSCFTGNTGRSLWSYAEGKAVYAPDGYKVTLIFCQPRHQIPIKTFGDIEIDEELSDATVILPVCHYQFQCLGRANPAGDIEARIVSLGWLNLNPSNSSVCVKLRQN